MAASRDTAGAAFAVARGYTMKKLSILAALLLLCPIAYAGDVSLTCTVPTENTDGSVLTDLAEIWVYYGPASGDYSGGREAMGLDCAHTLTLAEGTWYFAATAQNAAGVESDYSVEVAKVVEGTSTPTTPAPPTDLVVLADNLVAYALSMTADVLVTYPIGTVPPGTPCASSMSANGKYVVPRSAVSWETTQRPQVVVAECG